MIKTASPARATMLRMTKAATAALVLCGLTLGGAATASAASPNPYPGCKVVSVVTQTNPDINAANPNYVVTDVKYWTRTVTTLRCKGKTTQIVTAWYPVK